jgi:hypothetical protein
MWEKLSTIKPSATNAFSVSFPRLAQEVLTCRLLVMPFQCLGFRCLKGNRAVLAYKQNTGAAFEYTTTNQLTCQQLSRSPGLLPI